VEFPSGEIMTSPFSFYAELRALGPVVRLASRQEEFVITRHDALSGVARQPDLFLNGHSVTEEGYLRRATLADNDPDRVAAMITADRPAHTRRRKLYFHPLKPGRLKTYADLIEQHADSLIDAFAHRGRVELVHDFCEPFPSGVIGELLGLPREDRPKFVRWSRYEGHGARYQSPERRDANAAIVTEMATYCHDAVVSRVEDRRDDLISELIDRQLELDGTVDIANLVANLGNLLIGGIVTTAHLIASAMMLLFQHPDQLARVRADDRLVSGMFEEALRLQSPVQWQPRLVRENAEIEGVAVPAGAILLLLFGSANRDPAKFDDPETFDIERENAIDHLGFGLGIHFCLGAPLARLEAKIAYERLFGRLANLRLGAGNDFRPIDSLTFRGPRALELDFEPV
jgi:cytochrome P450